MNDIIFLDQVICHLVMRGQVWHHIMVSGQWSPGAPGTPVSCVSCAGPSCQHPELSGAWSSHRMSELIVTQTQCPMPMSRTSWQDWYSCHCNRGLTDLNLALPNPTSVKQSFIQNFSCIKSEMYNSGLGIGRKYFLQKPKPLFRFIY